MTKKELIAHLAEESGVTKAAAEKVLDTLVGVVLQRARDGEKTTIHGFGVFERVDRAARRARNPRTGETTMLDPVSVLRFKPSKMTREHLN